MYHNKRCYLDRDVLQWRNHFQEKWNSSTGPSPGNKIKLGQIIIFKKKVDVTLTNSVISAWPAGL